MVNSAFITWYEIESEALMPWLPLFFFGVSMTLKTTISQGGVQMDAFTLIELITIIVVAGVI
jgi:hypothetical protein